MFREQSVYRSESILKLWNELFFHLRHIDGWNEAKMKHFKKKVREGTAIKHFEINYLYIVVCLPVLVSNYFFEYHI